MKRVAALLVAASLAACGGAGQKPRAPAPVPPIARVHFEDESKQPLCILMHGDREVSAKNLARAIGAKTVGPCTPEVADRHSGYQVGGTSPFGLRRAMPIYMQRTILELSRIYINGGARGFLVAIDPRDAERVLQPTLVDVIA